MSTPKNKKKSATAQSFWLAVAALVLVVFLRYYDNGSLWPIDLGNPAESPAVSTPAANPAVNDPSAAADPNAEALPPPTEGEIRVSFIDVGQGDSILIQSPGGHAVLIDGGEYSERNKLVAYLEKMNIQAFDYVVATHPHSDHIGGLATILDKFEVKNLLMPDAINNTATFEKLLEAAENKDIPLTVPTPGDLFTAGIIELMTLAPQGTGYADLNNESIVLRMRYGNTAFLFTGDAEALSEKEMLNSGMDLRATILKLGHHGSKTSSSEAFLDTVNPSAVVISCGQGNKYNHPSPETLEKLAQRPHISVFRTDELGTIEMITDGEQVQLCQLGY